MIEKHGGNIYKYDHRVYDFSANLNPLGMPAAVGQAILENMDKYESYPDPDAVELKAAIAEFHGIADLGICCGNGAADIIFRMALALRPRSALIVTPTFTEYEEALAMAGCEIEHFELEEQNGFHVTDDIVDVIEQKKRDMVFVCNPNNPTGITVDGELMERIYEACRRTGARLVVDECFSEFTDNEESYALLPKIGSHPGAVIIKSFTKIFAMAGLRLGYCVCGDPADAGRIEGCMQTWPVSTASAKAGIAAMKVPGFVQRTKDYIRPERVNLKANLAVMGYRVYESEANYVFFRSGRALDEPLREHDILIRNCSNYRGLGDGYYRIAVRTKEENDIFIAAMNEITK
jgi:threonine-phosphate decarboxylase